MKDRATADSMFEENGVFSDASGEKIFGKLRVAGSDSQLSMWHGETFDVRVPAGGVMTGVLNDLTRVTLIDCISEGSAAGSAGGEQTYCRAEFFPHFVLKGTGHLDTASDRIESVTFFVEDAHVLFYDFDAFGSVLFDKELLKEVLKRRRVKRKVRTGKHPWVMYFTGSHNIISFDSPLGRITATHCPTANTGGASGVGMENRVGINLKPSAPVRFEEIPNRVHVLMRLLAVLIGRPQKLEETLLTVRRGKGATPMDKLLRMYWSQDSRPPRGSSKPHPRDVLLSPIRAPQEFKNVCTRWLEMDAERKDARGRFLSSFGEGNVYGVNRIVGAANMFDILPASAAPKTVTLTTEQQAAKAQAKKLFKALTPSDETQSLMEALNRLGTATLRRKMLHRADIVVAQVGPKFPNLDIVLGEAVRCRNHYVHGSPTRIDYSVNLSALSFLVETLEFVFAASDLVDAGWDIRAWCSEAHGNGHPFGEYKSNYSLALSELQKLLI